MLCFGFKPQNNNNNNIIINTSSNITYFFPLHEILSFKMSGAGKEVTAGYSRLC